MDPKKSKYWLLRQRDAIAWMASLSNAVYNLYWRDQYVDRLIDNIFVTGIVENN